MTGGALRSVAHGAYVRGDGGKSKVCNCECEADNPVKVPQVGQHLPEAGDVLRGQCLLCSLSSLF